MNSITYKDDTLVVNNLDVGAIISRDDSPEFAEVHTDENGVILYGVRKDGSFFWNKGIPEHLIKYIEDTYFKDKHLVEYPKVPLTDITYPFDFDSTEENWKGVNTISLNAKEMPWYYIWNGEYRYKNAIDAAVSYGATVVRIITHDIIGENISDLNADNPSNETLEIRKEFDNVLYYAAKKGLEICLTTHTVPGKEMENVTDWDPWFANIEALARRYNGSVLIKDDDPESEGIHVFVKYWEFCNEINTRISYDKQVVLQKNYYDTIKGINEDFIVLSLGYSAAVSDATLFYDPNYVNTFDIYNFHNYGMTVAKIIDIIEIYVNAYNSAFKKPLWITEHGYSYADFSPEDLIPNELERASLSAINVLISLCYGASKCLFWSAERFLNGNGDSGRIYRSEKTALETLYRFHGKGATKPKLEGVNGVYVARWVYNNMYYAALLFDKDVDVEVICRPNTVLYDCLGNTVNIINGVKRSIFYIENSKNIKLNFK